MSGSVEQEITTGKFVTLALIVLKFRQKEWGNSIVTVLVHKTAAQVKQHAEEQHNQQRNRQHNQQRSRQLNKQRFHQETVMTHAEGRRAGLAVTVR
ncbi:MAG: hypothetical protein ACE5DX_04685 [Candidatus Dojkabacteria bacterium]